MIYLEIYIDIVMVVLALAVDLVAFNLYRKASLRPNGDPVD